MTAPAARCSDGARLRDDSLTATATPAQRFLLVEVPGPWPRSPLRGARIDHGVTTLLAASAAAAGARLLLIRRPGRHPDIPHRAGLAWALADVRPGVEAVRWGRYHDDAELLGIDPAGPLDPAADALSGPQQVALVCTHGTRDVCCAVRGRPVAEAAAALPDWDVWECTHVGGDRFAANIVVLPTGDMFGLLDPDSAPDVLGAYSQGLLDPRHHRGRCGVPVVQQAAAALVAEAVDDHGRGAVLVGPVREVSAAGQDPAWDVAVVHAATGYVARIGSAWSSAAQLSCGGGLTRARRFSLLSFARIRPEQLTAAG